MCCQIYLSVLHNNMRKFILFFLACLFLISCVKRDNIEERGYTNHYAKGFDIVTCDNYVQVKVYSPWKKETMAVYYLVKNDDVKTPKDGTKMVVPLSKIALTSTTHVGFLKELDMLNVVCGVCNPGIIYNIEELKAARNKSENQSFDLIDIGDAMAPNVELIVSSDPQAVMVSTFAQGDAATEKLLKLGVPIIFNNEWTENHPLARAEWIRFVGAFVDKQDMADSLFSEIEKQYLFLKQKCAGIDEKKKIMTGNNFRGTWYMPSGNTYMGVLFQDAGAQYAYANDTSAFSLPLTIEKVVEKFSDADVWVGSSAKTLDELADIDSKHTWFKAYQTAQVYNFYKRTNTTGGNDFWETGVVHPELILSDLMLVLYPQMCSDKEFYFTSRLK